ncbi:MAG: shikimate kinase [Gemmatimonadota bacterium]|nr:shikimate kinase [Gemmatimonadota bacterium]MDE3005676.1 shikimate kinase [Gemmatimonadota bacterium]MDE3012479.1 shikimate kinase [Gemmatimonadota bacterium]
MFRRIVLVGFMGAGKTSVGEQLSSRLGWRFVDLDEELVARSGLSIDDWFDAFGEAAFRKEEAALARELLASSDLVLASGGGWAVEPDRLVELPPGTLSVWLDVGVEEAVRRVQKSSVSRPLLRGKAPENEARRLLEARWSAYAEAQIRVDTNGQSVEDVTSRILEILENEGTRTAAE